MRLHFSDIAVVKVLLSAASFTTGVCRVYFFLIIFSLGKNCVFIQFSYGTLKLSDADMKNEYSAFQREMFDYSNKMFA